jgi:hypothetical protein
MGEGGESGFRAIITTGHNGFSATIYHASADGFQTRERARMGNQEGEKPRITVEEDTGLQVVRSSIHVFSAVRTGG